jgi:hypothetical protein
MSLFAYIPALFVPGNLKRHLAASLRRVFGAKPWHYMLWWLFRGVILYALIRNLIRIFANSGGKLGNNEVQLIVVGLCTFMWEIFQFLPKNHVFRWMPPAIQDVSCMFCVVAVAGRVWSIYGRVPAWDSIVHIICGYLVVLAGYELVAAFERRDNIKFPRSATLLMAMGLSFFVAAFWEVFEFTFDQLADSNTQDWIYKESHEWIPALPSEAVEGVSRYALLDTMSDIIMHTISAFVAVVQLRFFPYRHDRRAWHRNWK